jgi:hypothetical protein
LAAHPPWSIQSRIWHLPRTHGEFCTTPTLEKTKYAGSSKRCRTKQTTLRTRRELG